MLAIILGGGLNPDGSLSSYSLARANTGLTLYKEGTVTSFLLSGGHSPRSKCALLEANCMKHYLVDHGIPEHQIQTETMSSDTIENARYTADKLARTKLALLITNGFHLLRAAFWFNYFGIDVIPCACDLEIIVDWKIRIREYGILALTYLRFKLLD